MKNKITYLGLFFITLVVVFSCSEEPEVEIEYQSGYPHKLAGNWVVFEFPNADLTTLYDPYDLVTALDPNNDSSLILDNLYNSGIRTRAEIVADTGFIVLNGPQLNISGSAPYGIESVSVLGFVNQNPVIISFVYDLARLVYPDLSFGIDDIEDALYLQAGFYDQYNSVVDTVIMFGYRKTGFEEVEY